MAPPPCPAAAATPLPSIRSSSGAGLCPCCSALATPSQPAGAGVFSSPPASLRLPPGCRPLPSLPCAPARQPAAATATPCSLPLSPRRASTGGPRRTRAVAGKVAAVDKCGRAAQREAAAHGPRRVLEEGAAGERDIGARVCRQPAALPRLVVPEIAVGKLHNGLGGGRGLKRG